MLEYSPEKHRELSAIRAALLEVNAKIAEYNRQADAMLIEVSNMQSKPTDDVRKCFSDARKRFKELSNLIASAIAERNALAAEASIALGEPLVAK